MAISIDFNATILNLRNQKLVCGKSRAINLKLPYFHWKKKIAEDRRVPLSQCMLNKKPMHSAFFEKSSFISLYF